MRGEAPGPPVYSVCASAKSVSGMEEPAVESNSEVDERKREGQETKK